MRLLKGFVALSLVLVLLLSCFSFSGVEAADTEPAGYGDTRYNIMFVIDRSYSLVDYDAQNNRFEALKYMFATLPATGNEMGAIVFRETVAKISPLKPISTQTAKDELLSKIMAEEPQRGGTDIGSAIYEATKALVAKQNEQKNKDGSHLESVVVLFTDGIIETGDRGTSFANRDRAIDLAKANGIKVFGVFLNRDGVIQNNQEVFDIVRKARNRADDPQSPRNADGSLNDLGRYYSEIRNPADIIGSFSNLVHLLTDGYDPPVAETVPVTKECIIPGIGVSELNIAVRYKPGVLNKISIKIERPDGTLVSDMTTRDITITKTDVFYNAKIMNPSAGKWIITVDKASNTPVAEKVEIIPDIIISTNVSAKLQVQTPEGGIKLNEPLTFTSWLEHSGEKVDDDNKYAFFECALTLIEANTKEKKVIPMKLNGKGSFVADVTFDNYDPYAAFATYTCDRIQFRTPEETLRASNRAPELKSDPLKDKFRYNWLFGKDYSIDLSKYVSDPEGGKLEYSVLGGDFDSAEINETGTLSLRVGKSGVGDVNLSVKDDRGAEVKFNLELTVINNSWLITLLAVLLLLVLAALIYGIYWLFFGGYINATILISVNRSSNQAVREWFTYKGPKEVSLVGFRKPSVNLYEVCTSILDALGKTERIALEELFNNNRDILLNYTLKRSPGLDRSKFVLLDKKTKFGEGDFSREIELNGDGGKERLRIEFRQQTRNQYGQGRNDYD